MVTLPAPPSPNKDANGTEAGNWTFKLTFLDDTQRTSREKQVSETDQTTWISF
jgi:hypothetical protein